MFIEPNRSGKRKGWIEVICGSMFSGKTEELIRRLKRVQFANQTVEIFKPLIDTRYDLTDIVSHDNTRIPSTPIESSPAILLYASNIDVVAIDEAQFFDAGLPEICNQLVTQGTRVIIAGLDMDYLGRPFGPMPALLSIADYITKLHAICANCGDMASISHRKNSAAGQILLGEKEVYEPLCRTCFNQSK